MINPEELIESEIYAGEESIEVVCCLKLNNGETVSGSYIMNNTEFESLDLTEKKRNARIAAISKIRNIENSEELG